MNEAYLHHLWKHMRFPTVNLTLTNGKPLWVKNFGAHNTDRHGPDFQFGSVQFDEITLHGHIELHVNSSDWYKHGHHLDPNYNNVILHVVHTHDQEVVQNGVQLPTLEINPFIDEKHYQRYRQNKLLDQKYPCHGQLSSLDPIYLESIKSKALIQKWSEKLRPLENCSEEESFYRLIGSAFGTSVNKVQFELLTEKFPLAELQQLPSKVKYQIIVIESGIIQEENADKRGIKQWNFKGTRPNNFPSIRVRQFAHFVSQFNFDTSFKLASATEIVQNFIRTITGCFSTVARPISQSFIRHLLINAVVPFLYRCAQEQQDENYTHKANDILIALPPERNGLIKEWQANRIVVESAYDTQGLIALSRYNCCRKKCLSCEVGNKLMNRTK